MSSLVAVGLSFPVPGFLMFRFPRSWWGTVLHPHSLMSAYVGILFFFVVLRVSSLLVEWSSHGIASVWRQSARSWHGLRHRDAAGRSR